MHTHTHTLGTQSLSYPVHKDTPETSEDGTPKSKEIIRVTN